MASECFPHDLYIRTPLGRKWTPKASRHLPTCLSGKDLIPVQHSALSTHRYTAVCEPRWASEMRPCSTTSASSVSHLPQATSRLSKLVGPPTLLTASARLHFRRKIPAVKQFSKTRSMTTSYHKRDNDWHWLTTFLFMAVCLLGRTEPAYSIAQSLTTNPEELSASDASTGPRLSKLIEGPKGGAVVSCTRKCLPACLRGGEGAPGLGPLTVRRDPVKFKDGFRSRAYCLSECTQVCAASITGVAAATVPQPDLHP